MPLLVNSVPNLAQGVSQQPDNLRYPGQCDEQINAWATVVEGLKKRPNTNYVKNIDSTSTSSNLFTHFVKRDQTNQYAIVVSLGNVSLGIPAGVSAYDVSLGTSIPVAVTSIANSYLSLGTSVTDPLNDLRALTVADYTFLVNKRKQVQKDTDVGQIPNKEALVFVKLGDYEKAYSIYINNVIVPLVSSLQGSSNTDYHDFSNTGHINGRTQEATYISGPADAVGGGMFADTEYIARDLEACLSEEYEVAGKVSVTSISVSNGGSGWLQDLYYKKNPTAGLKPLPTGWPRRLEFSVIQGANSSARGVADVVDGVIKKLSITNRGQGYDPALSTSLSFRMRFFHRGRWWTGVHNSPTVAPTTTQSIGTLSTYTIDRQGSVIRIQSRDPDNAQEDFDIRVNDGLADQGLGLVYKEVASITDLPKSCYNNFVVKVLGDADIDQDDYYVRFKTKDGTEFGEGSWVEVVGWDDDGSDTNITNGIKISIDPKTMPVILKPIFNASGKVESLKLQSPEEDERVEAPSELGWRNRNAGDNFTNPFPSFVSEEGAFVSLAGSVYTCIKAHTSTALLSPSSATDYWRAITPEQVNVKEWDVGVYYDAEKPKTINDVFFFKNRLGFVTDTSVIFSEADNYFNFFRTTTQQLLDSAPIDVGLSHTKVAILQHAIPFQEKLMLFSKQSQFVLRGADILSPKTVAISPVTEYDISDSVEPVALGNYIYFTFKRNDFEGMYEYFVDNNTEVFDAEEVTQQVPKYIPNNVRKIAGSQQENTICVGVDSDLKTLYVYKYFWSNKEKVQSAWMKFTFDRDVVGFDFIDSKLYMITKDTEGLHLEFLTLEDGLKDEGLAYPLLLDSRVDGTEVTVAAYDTSTKKTRISNIPYNVSLGTDIEIYTKIGTLRAITMVNDTTVDVTGALASYVSNGGTIYKCETTHTAPSSFVAVDTSVTPNVTYWSVSTDVTSAPTWSSGNFYNNDKYFVIGKPYNMTYRFSDQSLKQPTERGGRSASDYTYQTIRNGSINYADTGHFVVEVTPEYRDTYKYVFNPDITGANLLLNEFVPQDGHFRFAVQGQPDKVTIEVKSDSALPCKLLAAEFESMVVPRSRRYGS